MVETSMVVRMLKVSAIAAGLGWSGTVAAGPYDTRRMDEIPDFSQTHPDLRLPNGGSHYCAPVAAANGLVWFARHRGYRRLLPVTGVTLSDRVAEVALTLGDETLMSTAPKGGTSIGRFLTGLDGYVAQQGYKARLHYRGVWRVERRFHDGDAPPDIDWMIRRFDRNEAVWATVGFYQQSGRDEYSRIGGHFITMVGYGVDARGRNNRKVVVFHDSDDGDDAARARHLKLSPMQDGWIVHRDGRRGKEAKGILRIDEGYTLKPGVVALIDSAIAFSL
ncbi:MAG: hypothetical protein AAFV62_10735 [Pseudomonadota bacterium]